jgi:uncharacterized membrane protein
MDSSLIHPAIGKTLSTSKYSAGDDQNSNSNYDGFGLKNFSTFIIVIFVVGLLLIACCIVGILCCCCKCFSCCGSGSDHGKEKK